MQVPTDVVEKLPKLLAWLGTSPFLCTGDSLFLSFLCTRDLLRCWQPCCEEPGCRSKQCELAVLGKPLVVGVILVASWATSSIPGGSELSELCVHFYHFWESIFNIIVMIWVLLSPGFAQLHTGPCLKTFLSPFQIFTGELFAEDLLLPFFLLSEFEHSGCVLGADFLGIFPFFFWHVLSTVHSTYELKWKMLSRICSDFLLLNQCFISTLSGV